MSIGIQGGKLFVQSGLVVQTPVDCECCDAEIGACCVSEVCTQETQPDCGALGGAWLPGVPCDPNPCQIVACCRDQEPICSCVNTGPAFCESMGGTPLFGQMCETAGVCDWCPGNTVCEGCPQGPGAYSVGAVTFSYSPFGEFWEASAEVSLCSAFNCTASCSGTGASGLISGLWTIDGQPFADFPQTADRPMTSAGMGGGCSSASGEVPGCGALRQDGGVASGIDTAGCECVQSSVFDGTEFLCAPDLLGAGNCFATPQGGGTLPCTISVSIS